jgi:glutamate racemase
LIGVFDSGVGGLSVLSQIRNVLPDADLTYVADRARAPYGVRSLEEVEAISIDIGGKLIERGASCLVVACNTASAAALEPLRDRFTVPIVGMEPAVKPAALASRTGKVAVVATAVTFQGRLFESVVSRFARDVDVMTAACPRWVELVESGVVDGSRAEKEIADVLGPMIAAGADVVVLACTHFSFLSGVITDLFPVDVIDPAPAVAAQTARVAPDVDGGGTLTLTATGDLDEFGRLASALASITEPVIPFES